MRDPSPQEDCVVQLFEARVERAPGSVALISGDGGLTFDELNRRANQLAHALLARGVVPGSAVGICLPPSTAAVIAVFAVLKAGSFYVPIDPSDPTPRKGSRLARAGVAALITETMKQEQHPGLSGVHLFSPADPRMDRQDTRNPGLRTPPESLCSVLYTSGSSGAPKGACGTNAGTLHRLSWLWSAYPLQPGEVCCQKTPLTFVDSSLEIFGKMGFPIRE